MAQAAIETFLSKANEPAQVEVIVRIHEDDPASMGWAQTRDPHVRVLIGDTERGYASMDHYLNALGAVSNGDWLWPASDGAKMLTQGWDRILASRLKDPRTQLLVVNPDVMNDRRWHIPVMSRGLWHVLGHWGLTAHCDCYLDSLTHFAGIRSSVAIEVEEPNLPLVGERDQGASWAEYRSAEVARAFDVDKIKLGAVLGKDLGKWTTSDAPAVP